MIGRLQSGSGARIVSMTSPIELRTPDARRRPTPRRARPRSTRFDGGQPSAPVGPAAAATPPPRSRPPRASRRRSPRPARSVARARRPARRAAARALGSSPRRAAKPRTDPSMPGSRSAPARTLGAAGAARAATAAGRGRRRRTAGAAGRRRRRRRRRRTRRRRPPPIVEPPPVTGMVVSRPACRPPTSTVSRTVSSHRDGRVAGRVLHAVDDAADRVLHVAGLVGTVTGRAP